MHFVSLAFMEILTKPWPWYVAGPLIGLTVPLLLIIGNRAFGVSSTLRHICAACFPGKIPFFNYEWKKETWNLFLVTGIFIGGFIANVWLSSDEPIQINAALQSELAGYGITTIDSLWPTQLFNFENVVTLKGFMVIVLGGFLVGFGTRYAGGCTSGHSIFGLSTLQWPSLVATICFMVGGMVMANFILPIILSL